MTEIVTNRKAKVFSLQVFILDFFIKHNLFWFKIGPDEHPEFSKLKI